MAKQLLISIRITIVLLLIVSGVYPLVVWGISQAAFKHQADGSLVTNAQGTVVKDLAAAYRKDNGLTADAQVPVDAVTRSASGLDPQISPANAALQASRVAKARGVSADVVAGLMKENTQGRGLGFLGEPAVNVLTLNIALDKAAPAK